jgi:hypothetical protein
LIEQEKKDKKKKSRLEKSVNDEEDDNLKFIINKFSDKNAFIAFKNKNKNDNASHAKNAKYENLHINYSIEKKFHSKNFFDDINDKRVF